MPYVHKMEGVTPLLISTAYKFATHPRLQEFLLNETISDFIIHLIEMLVLLCGEQNYLEIFVKN